MNQGLSESRVRLRPRSDTIHISRGRTVLGMAMNGTISRKSFRQGLFVLQTRMISEYRWKFEGKLPNLSCHSPVAQHSWLSYYYDAPPNCAETPPEECNPRQQTVEMKVARVVGEGMHEDVEVINHTQITTSFTLSLELDADFAARSELKDGRKQHGKLSKQWRERGRCEWELQFNYTVEHAWKHQGDSGVASMERGITLHLKADSEASYSGSEIAFTIELKPHQTWSACLQWQPAVDGTKLPVEPHCHALLGSGGEYSRKEAEFLSESAYLHTPATSDISATVQRVLDRARQDLISLRMFDLDEGEDDWKLAAGIPTYLAVFGRDVIAAAWQATLLSTDMIRGGLSLLKKRQAKKTDLWRDAEPGRFLHEAHTDPLSVLNFTPQALYYGTLTTPFLFPIVATELWHWTGKKEMVRPYIGPALEALKFADSHTLADDGFYKYKQNSEQGVKNQGWKDSYDAIVYEDGAQVKDPLGTCEIQAFAYAAKLQMAEVLWWLDETDLARKLHDQSSELKKRFNDRFWMNDENFIGMAVDQHGRISKSVASDPGHCLLSGIIETGRVERFAQRLMKPDLFSGWGIRTLSSDHPAYNPFSYHRGTVWPVEQGGFVLGLARYGLHEAMWKLARAQFEAATMFEYDRLPEVFGGHTRDDRHPFPCLYEPADFPQAWSASSTFAMIQALLGIYPYAPLNTLLLDPKLPDWLPEVTLERLRVGDADVDIRFRRNSDGNTDYTVLRKEGTLHVVRQPSPSSLTADWGERVKDAITSLLHGK